MIVDSEFKKVASFQHLEMLAHQIVEGFISGMHKSPFHGFSAEFAEHKMYNNGESTKFIDWKLFAKTDRLYTKRFEEETNLRCHIIVDNSSSMHFPKLNANQLFYENKIGFSVLAAAVLMNLLKKQRDAVGLSIFSDKYDFYTSEKGNDRHHRMVLNQLESLILNKTDAKTTNTIASLHQIAEKMHRRSMIILFTDMFQSGNENELMSALQHLKHNKHKVVLFHVTDHKTELNFDYDNAPRKFIDLETQEEVAVFADNIKDLYEKSAREYFKKIELTCNQNKIKYVKANVGSDFDKIITTYLVEKQSFR
jgi:uncharacterized protein (DUF58 family)